jgi:MFS family permease
MKRGLKFAATLVSIALVAVMAALDQTVVATALPHMIGLFMVDSLLCGVATSMGMLVLFRAIQRIGAGSINTMSFIVMGDLFQRASGASGKR